MRIFHWSGTGGYETFEVYAFVEDHEGIEEAKQILEHREGLRFDGDNIVRSGQMCYCSEVIKSEAHLISHSG